MDEFETKSRIVILDTEDVSELFKKKQSEMSEDDAYRSVGASISIAIGQSIDVTRSEKGYADLLKSVREECEQGLSVALHGKLEKKSSEADGDKDENKDKEMEEEEENDQENFCWSYLLKPRDTVLSTISKK